MTHAFLGRISRSYSDISQLISCWAEQSEFMWVYQHDADDKVNTTHCHLFVIGSQRDAEGLKKLVSWKKMNFSGNKDSSFKMYNKVFDIVNNGEWYNCLKYASKGVLDPVYIKGASALEIATLSKSKWEIKEEQSKQDNIMIQEKKKRVTQFDIARMAQSAYMERYTEEIMGKPYLEFNVSKLVDIVTSLLRANRMCSNYRVVAGIIQDIKCDLDPNSFKAKILSMV